jgi:chromosome partitioning protein
LTDAMLEELARAGAPLAKTRIGNRVAFAGALAEGQGITELQPRGRAAEEIKSLAREVQRHVKAG